MTLHTGIKTGKILNYEVRSKQCRQCDQHGDECPHIMGDNASTAKADHDCGRNWGGSSKAMEPDMAVAG